MVLGLTTLLLVVVNLGLVILTLIAFVNGIGLRHPAGIRLSSVVLGYLGLGRRALGTAGIHIRTSLT